MYRVSKHDWYFFFGLIAMIALAVPGGIQWPAVWMTVLYLQLWVFWKVYRDNRYLRQTIHRIRSLRYGSGDYPLPETASGPANELVREFNLVYAALDRERLNAERARAGIENQVYSRTRELDRQLKQVSHSAGIDDLSGLANRRQLECRSAELFDRAVKTRTDLCCVMIDVDFFKETNDQWGHQAGDRVISFIGELLRASTRSTDLCARFGGDEFVMILPNCSARNALALADRIRRVFAREVGLYIQDSCRQTIDPSDVLPRLSIGIASLHGDQPLTVEQLRRMADAALYKAKGAGKNRIAAYAS